MNIAPPRPAGRDIATVNDIGVLVRHFYRAAIPDPLLGPVFERFGVDWPTHIPKLVGYWTHALLDGANAATNTVAAHGPVQRAAPFGPRHVARWIELWDETVDEWYAGPVATRAKQRARRVGRALDVIAGRQRSGEAT